MTLAELLTVLQSVNIPDAVVTDETSGTLGKVIVEHDFYIKKTYVRLIIDKSDNAGW